MTVPCICAAPACGPDSSRIEPASRLEYVGDEHHEQVQDRIRAVHIRLYAAMKRPCFLEKSLFVRIHKTLRTTPAMAANVTKRLWEIGDIVDLLETWEASNAR